MKFINEPPCNRIVHGDMQEYPLTSSGGFLSMGIMTRLDHRGHGPIAEWGDDKLSTDAAAKVFAEHQGRGFTMYDITDNVGKKLETFDPTAQEILASPRMKGG